MSILTKFIFLCVFCHLTSIGITQIEFKLAVSSQSISQSEQLHVKYTVEGTREGVESPRFNFHDWNVLAGPNTSSNMSIINGKRSSSISYSFVLSPKSSGSLVVPSADVLVQNQKYTSNSITIQVSAAANPNAQGQQQAAPHSGSGSIFDIFDDFFNRPRPPQTPGIAPGQTPENFMQENNLIKVTPSKSVCYIGEPVLVTYEFYSGMAASSARVTTQPSFEGASVIEMLEEKQPYRTTYNGKEYMASRIRQAQLIPLKTGNLVLEKAEVSMEMMANEGSGAKKYATTISNAPSSISVQPLPPGAPAGFNGNVGNFHISAEVDRDNLPAGETNYLRITISGSGNIDGIKYPNVQFPASLQPFPYTDSQSVDKQIFPMQATKTFKVPFIAHTKGDVTIPPIHFSFFDNIENTYKTLSTNPITLQFTEALPQGTYERPIQAGYAKYKWLLAFVLLTGILIIILLVSSKKKKKKVTPEKTITKRSSIPHSGTETPTTQAPPLQDKQRLKQNIHDEVSRLESMLEDKNFYTQAKRILLLILNAYLNTMLSSENQITDALEKSSLPNTTKQDFEALLNNMNKEAYLPIINLDERRRILSTLKYFADRQN